jgi:hypothetical protein
MKKSDLFKLARNPRLISGIYNYCDRWCERCPFTDRCLNYAMEQEENRRAGGSPKDSAAFWKRFEASLKLTKEMVLDTAKERGITFDPAEMEEIGREEERKRRVAEKHPLARAGMKYIKMVDRWFKTGEAVLKEKEEEILAQARLGVGGVNEEVASLTDAVEILRWYQHQIYVKLMRGLDADKDYEATSGFPKDSDGSVKVALMAMDRSIGAWLRMKEFFPDKTDSILTMLVHLDRLRRAAEKEFPAARAFVRPGFDVVESAPSKRRN